MNKNPWIQTLKDIFSRFKNRTVIKVKFEVSKDEIKIISTQIENSNFLSNIGNSIDCPISREYSEKFLDTFGRLTVKGRKHV